LLFDIMRTLSRVWLDRVGTVVGALGVAPAACALAFLVHGWLRGRNVSDVGVRMYEHADLAALGGLAVLVVSCGLALWLLARTVGRRGLLAYWVGVPWMLAWSFLFLIGAAWS
jgi:hypothetical protein